MSNLYVGSMKSLPYGHSMKSCFDEKPLQLKAAPPYMSAKWCSTDWHLAKQCSVFYSVFGVIKNLTWTQLNDWGKQIKIFFSSTWVATPKTFFFRQLSFCSKTFSMEQCALKDVNNCLNANIYSYLEASGGQSFNLYLNALHFFNTSVNKIFVAA